MAKRKSADGSHAGSGERLGIGGNGGPSDEALRTAKKLEDVARRLG